jgi:hypothetical protein
MVIIENQARISCKIKQDNNEKFDCTLCEPWIKTLLGHNLKSQKDCKTKQGLYLHLFKEKKTKREICFEPNYKAI